MGVMVLPDERVSIMKIEENIRQRLAGVTQSGPPKLASFARWMLDHLHDVAFQSTRGLAQQAGVDPNLVGRLARELGYEGYDAFRIDVQQIVQTQGQSYEARARALRNRPDSAVYAEVAAASRDNIERVSSGAVLAEIDQCIDPLLTARRVYSVGVRSCYSIAHYLAYVGSMAFDNFIPVPAVPGEILDQISQSGPEDVVIAIAYDHYSAEVVRACQVANACGARVLALTDSHASPIALGAWKVIPLPMAGPQLLPSLNTAFLAVELILSAMAARSPDAAGNIARYEDRISRFGGYVRP
jgi:DNA-binding MurR/RpiR family transcriptional regulator